MRIARAIRVVGVAAVVCFAVAIAVPQFLAWGSSRKPCLEGDVKPGGGTPRDLVVIVHGLNPRFTRLDFLERVVRETHPKADVYIPGYPAGLFSNADPYEVADELEQAINRLDQENHYQKITLVGFSIGSLLLRKAFLWGTGANSLRDRPSSAAGRSEWTAKVERIVLLSGTNRGWSLDVRPRFMPPWKYWGSLLARTLAQISGTGRLVLQLRRGAPFVADLRVQWIRHARPRTETEAWPTPLVVQLLGSVDDIVTRSDNEDTAAAKDFVFIPVVGTGHASILDLYGPNNGPIERERLARVKIRPHRPGLEPPRTGPESVRGASRGGPRGPGGARHSRPGLLE